MKKREQVSYVSTTRRCDFCQQGITRVCWWSCEICKEFDLCDDCYFSKSKQVLDFIAASVCKGGPEEAEQEKEVSQRKHSVVETNYSLQDVKLIEKRYQKIFEQLLTDPNAKVSNNRDQWLILSRLEESNEFSEEQKTVLARKLMTYQLENRKLNLLNLDGGGVRGYLPIKLLKHFIDDIGVGSQEKNQDLKKQMKFVDEFDYIAGTSTGGLIACALFLGVPLSELEVIYKEFKEYFVLSTASRFTRGVPIFDSKYNPEKIHKKIGEMLRQAGNMEEWTLGDVYKWQKEQYLAQNHSRERHLIISSFNTSTSQTFIFNSNFPPHHVYKIKDILCATMAAPTYFPPYKMTTSPFDTFVDGGIFANDPELGAIWAARMDNKSQPVSITVLGIGTGVYQYNMSSTWGGYFGWVLKGGALISVILEANRSFIETLTAEIGRFANVKRFRFNLELKQNMELDDPSFISMLDKKWPEIVAHPDYRSLRSFYGRNFREKSKTSF